MTRSRWRSGVAAWLLLGGLVLGNWSLASAQPTLRDSIAASAAPSSSTWPWALVLLVGVGLGVLGTRLLSKRPTESAPPPGAAVPVAPRPVAQNVPRENSPGVPQSSSSKGRSNAKAGGRAGESVQERLIRKEMEKKWHDDNQKPTPLKRPRGAAENRPKPAVKAPTPVAQPPKTAKNPPMEPNTADSNADESLSLGQTIDLSPKPIEELIDETATEMPLDRDGRADSLEALEAAAASVPAAGPLHFYAPAPDVPSIEHRKLSPNPLPQMPLLITLPNSEATTAQFSFSPQADQSRIIGNGVRELKEFFQFELPPTERFTIIRNLSPGKLEKRDGTWHVVDKATIALS